MKTPFAGALPFLLLAFLAGCGARSTLVDGGGEGCPPDPPDCVMPGDDPCGPGRIVAAECAPTHAFRCPAGARPYARAAAAPASCLPFSDPAGPIRSLGGGLVRVPTDDGRCLWIAETVETTAGEPLRNVAFEPDRAAPFASCPTQATFPSGRPVSAVRVDGGDDPSILVQISGAYRFAGSTRVLYRLFRLDAAAVFGVTELGSGVGRWDAASGRIVVPGPGALRFAADLDLGDASLVSGDRAYVWGCPRQGHLDHECVVGRFDAAGALQLFAGQAGWIDSQRGADAATVLASGPWISSVLAHPTSGGLLHVYAPSFGSAVQAHVAPAPEGPWSDAGVLGGCELPAGDPHAYCAGAVVHEELSDPAHPGELVVSYGVGTTATGGPARPAHPEAYWTRLAWVRAP